MTTLSQIPSDQARFQAGKYAISAPIHLIEKIDRGNRPILRVGVDVRDTQFFLHGMPMMPMAGDVIGVFPQNDPEDVNRFLPFLAKDEAETYFLSGQFESCEGQHFSAPAALARLSLNPVKPAVLQHLLQAFEEMDKVPISLRPGLNKLRALQNMLEFTPEEGKSILRHSHIGDWVSAFPGMLSLTDLCALQGATYRRVFTISGIERDETGQPRTIQFLVATGVQYTVPDSGINPGATYEGICSGYIRRMLARPRGAGSAYCAEVFIQPRSFGAPEKHRSFTPGTFTPPPSPAFLKKLKSPLLCIGAGSGISGIRAILEERYYWHRLGYEVGSAVLLFGLRNKATDFLFEADWQYYLEAGILDEVALAASRPQNGPKRYVQHLLIDGVFKRELKEVLQGDRTMIVCGDRKMGQTLVNGCLPILLPRLFPQLFPKDLQAYVEMDGEAAARVLFKWGATEVRRLRDQGLIIRSCSGSRYPKIEPGFDEVYSQFFAPGQQSKPSV